MSITIQGLSKSYGSQQVLKGFSHEFKDGSITCVMGKSGEGKTTLLNILMGLTDFDEGTIEGIEKKRIGAVFQEDRLCENLTGLLNVKMVAMSHRYSDANILEFFKEIDIDVADSKCVREYSGGMKRRVAILRALLSDFDLLIMDEPLKGLDEETKEKTVELIKRLAGDRTVIFSSHSTEEANLFGAEILPLS